MTPTGIMNSFRLNCEHEGAYGPPFEVPYGSLPHASQEGKIVFFGICPHGERVEVDDGVVPRTREVLVATAILREQMITEKLRKWAELGNFISNLPPINW